MLQSPWTDHGTRQRHHLWGSLVCTISDNSYQSDFIKTTDWVKYFLYLSYLIIILLIYEMQNKIGGRLTNRETFEPCIFLRKRITNITPQPLCFHPKQQLLWWQYNSSASPFAWQKTCIWGGSGGPQECKFSKGQLDLTVLPGYFSLKNCCKAPARPYSVHLSCCELSPSGHGDLEKEKEKTWLNFCQSTHRHTWTWFCIPWSWRLWRLTFHARVI